MRTNHSHPNAAPGTKFTWPTSRASSRWARGGDRPPTPRGHARQARAGLGRADRTVLARAEARPQRIALAWPHPPVVPEVLGKRSARRCRVASPWPDGMRGALAHPGGAPDAPACAQARADAHEEVGGGALAMPERAQGLEQRAAPGATQQWPPGTATRMALGAEIAPAHPARGPARVHRRRHGAWWGGPPRVATHDGAWAVGVGGASVVGPAVAGALGHAPWRMTHSHTRAPRPNGSKKRGATRATPPHTRATMRGLSLVFPRQE